MWVHILTELYSRRHEKQNKLILILPYLKVRVNFVLEDIQQTNFSLALILHSMDGFSLSCPLPGGALFQALCSGGNPTKLYHGT